MKHFCICGHGWVVHSNLDKRPCLLNRCECQAYSEKPERDPEDLPDEAYDADDFKDQRGL